MSLTTYANLQAAVISTLHRADLATAVPDFVTLAEDKLNKRLRLRNMRTRATSSISSEYVALPTGFLAAANFQINTTPRVRLEYASPEWLDIKYPDASDTGKPAFWTFVGGEIQLAPVPDGTYTLEMDYYKKLDLATDLNNWLLTNSPRCYYYGTLMEASAYLVNDKRVSLWSTLLENAIKELETADASDKQPEYGLAMRPDGPTPCAGLP